MITKKPLFALAAVACFALTSCTSETSNDDSVYQQGIDRKDVQPDNKGIDRKDVQPSNKKKN
ncbi:peptidase m28 [Cellulophaga sp. HaHaR_3_176]|uniref:peptidase m28 n=1 Tax=Cellulophaga sp. HaHaR_3_176 TaxID=1942464 RepID=UPI001C1FEF1C|nr:peptidase m28 [Cellulophaga sp. HaHaR_3_176]QWX85352.1 peptidase m28 [Cellulophaga sp. HaHaR_3_176]